MNTKDFKIFETMLVKDGNILFKDEHVRRMKKSAEFFGFNFCGDTISRELDKKINEMRDATKILKFELDVEGGLTFYTRDFVSNQSNEIILKVSDIILDANNVFLRHKTTHRPWYEKTADSIKSGAIYDEIFINQFGEVCEGSRSNVFVEIDGNLFTPPIDSGLLPGILSENLLKTGKCKERKIFLGELQNLHKIYLGNSVRGLVEVVLADLEKLEK